MVNFLIRQLADASAIVNCPNGTNTTQPPSGTCNTGLPQVNLTSSSLHTALGIFFGVAAGISVIMIIIGGLMFVTSGGNPQEAAKARQTIIFAAIGLIVSLLAEAVVAFVLGYVNF